MVSRLIILLGTKEFSRSKTNHINGIENLLKVPGEHNRKNAALALAICAQLSKEIPIYMERVHSALHIFSAHGDVLNTKAPHKTAYRYMMIMLITPQKYMRAFQHSKSGIRRRRLLPYCVREVVV